MRFSSAISALAIAVSIGLPAASTAHAASGPSASGVIRLWPPIIIPNPNHYAPLDTVNAVVTSLNEWTPTSLPDNVDCYPWNDPGLYCMSDDYSPFSVDLGGGVEVGSILDVKTKSVTSQDIDSITFDSGSAGTSFLHLTGFLDTPNDAKVSASIQGSFASVATIVNRRLTYVDSTVPYGALILALQTQDAANNWNDVALSYLSPTFIHGGSSTTITMNVNAKIPTGSGVRAELRVGTAFQNQSSGFTVLGGQMVVPICIPDAANPGSCL